MKKNILMLLLGGMMMMPTIVMACPDGGDDDYPDVWRSPTKPYHAYINYDEVSGVATVNFLSTVNDVVIIVYLNGIEVDNHVLDAEEGTQIPIYLPTYGCGNFTVQVKSGSILLATYSITL